MTSLRVIFSPDGLQIYNFRDEVVLVNVVSRLSNEIVVRLRLAAHGFASFPLLVGSKSEYNIEVDGSNRGLYQPEIEF